MDKFKKLSTHEDKMFIHKILGITCLCNYLYRFGRFFYCGDMNLKSDLSYYLIFCHMLLSSSSLIFRISDVRHKSLTLIYPELRLHSIAFTARHVVCFLLSYYEFDMIYKIITCFLTMMIADLITYYTKSEEKKYGTTIRGLPPYPNQTDKERKRTAYMYSEGQGSATIFVIYNITTAFTPLFAIQLVAFLMTLGKKGIIKDSVGRLIYILALWINLFILTILNISNIISIALCVFIFKYLRLKYNYSKYIVWSINFTILYLTKDLNFFGDYNNSKLIISVLIFVILSRYISMNHFVFYKF